MNNEVLQKDGMIQTGAGTSVNPNFISDQGIQDAKRFASGSVNTMNAGDLVNFTPIKGPEMTPSTNSSAISGSVESKITQAKADYDASVQNQLSSAQVASQNTEKSFLDTIKEKISNLGSRQTLEEQAKVPELNTLAVDAFNDLQKSKQAQANEIDAINKSNMTDFGRQQALKDVTNKYALQNANLSVSYDVANRNYLAAKQGVDDKIAALNEPLDEQIKYYEKLLTINTNSLTTAEKNALEAKKSEYETLRSEQTDEVNAIFDIQKQASENGADYATIQAIGKAKTRGEALQAAGQFLGEKDTQIIDVGGTKQLIDMKTGKVLNTFGGSPVDVSGLTEEQASDPFVQKMLKTKGGKNLTDTPLQQINKGLTVLGQLGTLQTNINNTKTGPILGAFKGANPWDTNAQTIKAQLNAVVPNLARGVYGEVGVLTDNDIKTYSSTIGNLKSTNDVNNAIMYITLDLIGKSITNTIQVQAAGGRDVSGFVDIYTEMQNTKSSILQSLPQPANSNQGQFLIQIGDKQLDLASFEK